MMREAVVASGGRGRNRATSQRADDHTSCTDSIRSLPHPGFELGAGAVLGF